MLAIDTNVLVRYLVRDDARQAAKAATLVVTNEIFVGITVVLETEWVLRSLYGFAGLPNLAVEDPELVSTALDWSRQGADFADSLHLLRSQHCEAFVSFDRELARRVHHLGTTKVRMP